VLQHALVTNPDTFLTDPEKEYEKQYEAWLGILEDQLTADRLSKMMAANPDLHSQYTTLVPDQVMPESTFTTVNACFWSLHDISSKHMLELQDSRPVPGMCVLRY
jgi:hypothetical protein